MICTLCLAEIENTEDAIEVNQKMRHKQCSEKLEEMVSELEKVYQDDQEGDIYK